MSPTLLAIANAALRAHAVPTTEGEGVYEARLRATAAAAVRVVEAAAPLPGLTTEGTLRLVLATAIVESSGLLPDVDTGKLRGDHGRSVCLMQINVGTGRVASADPHPMRSDRRSPSGSGRSVACGTSRSQTNLHADVS